MKRAFTIYIPDDCYLKLLNACVLVEKENSNGKENGMTIFTMSKDDFKGDDQFLFTITGKAERVDR